MNKLVIYDYLKELRVHHYIKNLLVFVPLACSGNLFELQKVLMGSAGFTSFCMVASMVYIINDIRDVEKDRKHPIKCKRPIAAGKISIRSAWIMTLLLFFLAIFFELFVFSIFSSILLVLYLLLNMGYSFGLKNRPIIDVTILVSGFLIRILYGAVITDIEISNWLYLTIIAVAFYFALGKRRNELKLSKSNDTRKVLEFYSEGFLDKNMYMCLGLANTFYALWAMDKSGGSGNDRFLIWTVPVLLLIFMRYSLNIEGNSDGDPVEVLLHDKELIVLCVAYSAIMGIVIYL